MGESSAYTAPCPAGRRPQAGVLRTAPSMEGWRCGNRSNRGWNNCWRRRLALWRWGSRRGRGGSPDRGVGRHHQVYTLDPSAFLISSSLRPQAPSCPAAPFSLSRCGASSRIAAWTPAASPSTASPPVRQIVRKPRTPWRNRKTKGKGWCVRLRVTARRRRFRPCGLGSAGEVAELVAAEQPVLFD